MLICLTAENNINNIILLLTIEKMKIIWYNLSVMWRGARVVERGGLENRCGPCGLPRVRIPLPPLVVRACVHSDSTPR